MSLTGEGASSSYEREPVQAGKCPQSRRNRHSWFSRGPRLCPEPMAEDGHQSGSTAGCSAISVTGAYTPAAQGDIAPVTRTAGIRTGQHALPEMHAWAPRADELLDGPHRMQVARRLATSRLLMCASNSCGRRSQHCTVCPLWPDVEKPHIHPWWREK